MKLNIRRRVLQASAAVLCCGSLAVASGIGTSSASSSSAPGVTSNSVTIGATVPLTGPADVYAQTSAAALAAFEYVNSTKHGINGRHINYIRLNDCYNLAPLLAGCGNLSASQTTLTQTEVLVTEDHVFATVGSLGTAAQETVLSYLNTNKVPQLYVNSGASQWNNDAKYPYTYGFQASYQTEGQIFASLIKKSYTHDTVGFIGQNDGFGQDGYVGLTKSTGVTITDGENLYSWTDSGGESDLTTPIKNLADSHVKVVVLDSIPPITSSILSYAATLHYSPIWIISQVGADPISVNNSLENNAISFSEFPASNANTNVWMKFTRSALEADTTDFPGFNATTPIDGNEIYGVAFAVAFMEALHALGSNITVANLLKAMTSTKYANPGVVPLVYSSKNHQGYTCGLITTIHSGGSASTEYNIEPNTKVSCSTGKTPVKVTTGTYKVAAIPSYI